MPQTLARCFVLASLLIVCACQSADKANSAESFVAEVAIMDHDEVFIGEQQTPAEEVGQTLESMAIDKSGVVAVRLLSESGTGTAYEVLRSIKSVGYDQAVLITEPPE